MDNKPKALTKKEIDEIAAMEDVREMWGVETAKEFARHLDEDACAVRFEFVSGLSPGYCGDVFLIMGEALDHPLILVRDEAGKIKISDANQLDIVR